MMQTIIVLLSFLLVVQGDFAEDKSHQLGTRITEILDRSLAQLETNDDFRQSDDDFQDSSDSACQRLADSISWLLPSGTMCACPPGGNTIFCRFDNQCDLPAEGCAHDQVCFSGNYTTTFEAVGARLKRISASYEVDMNGADYTGHRRVFYLDFDDREACDYFFSINDQEYKCNSCSLCGDDDYLLGSLDSIDCSNIQADAISMGCDDDDNTDDVGIALCVDGGAPAPTSGGSAIEQVAQNTSGSGRSSASFATAATMGTVLFACLAA